MTSDDKLVGERLRGRVEYWKQITSIQMHFNDLCIRTRWLGLTAIATLIAAAAVTAKEDIELALPFAHSIGLPSVLLVISLLVFVSLWFLDHQYYYKMLIASVRYEENLETQVMSDLNISGDGITAAISKAVSRTKATCAVWVFYILIGIMIVLSLVGSFHLSHLHPA